MLLLVMQNYLWPSITTSISHCNISLFPIAGILVDVFTQLGENCKGLLVNSSTYAYQ